MHLVMIYLNGALLNRALLNVTLLKGALVNGPLLNRALLNGARLKGVLLHLALLNRAFSLRSFDGCVWPLICMLYCFAEAVVSEQNGCRLRSMQLSEFDMISASGNSTKPHVAIMLL